MKSHFFPALLISALSIFTMSCGGEADTTDSEALKISAETGRRDALEAVSHPRGSMERENAVFRIRARESALREAGHDSCASSYANAAGAVIDSVVEAERSAE